MVDENPMILPWFPTRYPNGPSAKKHEPQERLVKAAQIALEESGDVEEVWKTMGKSTIFSTLW